MRFDADPPRGLAVSSCPDAVTIQVRPLSPSAASGWAGQLLLPLGVGVLGWGLLPYERSALLAVAGVALVFGGLGLQLWSDVRDRARVELRLGRDDLRIRVLLGARTLQESRVFLREVGRVGLTLAGGRPQVRVRARGRTVVIPMHPHADDAATWVARALATSGRRAAARDQVHDTPPDLVRVRQLRRNSQLSAVSRQPSAGNRPCWLNADT